eukprot:gene16168-7531_t
METQKGHSLQEHVCSKKNADCSPAKKPSLLRARRKLVFEDRSEGGGGSPLRMECLMTEHRNLLSDVQASERSRCLSNFNFDLDAAQPAKGRFNWEKVGVVPPQTDSGNGSRKSLIH